MCCTGLTTFCSHMGSAVFAALLKGKIIFLTRMDSVAPELSSTDLQSTSTDPWTKMLPPPAAESSTNREQHLCSPAHGSPLNTHHQLQALQDAGRYSSCPWAKWVLLSVSYIQRWDGPSQLSQCLPSCPSLLIWLLMWPSEKVLLKQSSFLYYWNNLFLSCSTETIFFFPDLLKQSSSFLIYWNNLLYHWISGQGSSRVWMEVSANKTEVKVALP